MAFATPQPGSSGSWPERTKDWMFQAGFADIPQPLVNGPRPPAAIIPCGRLDQKRIFGRPQECTYMGRGQTLTIQAHGRGDKKVYSKKRQLGGV